MTFSCHDVPPHGAAPRRFPAWVNWLAYALIVPLAFALTVWGLA